MTTLERGAMWLFAVDSVCCITGFVFTGDFILFFLSVFGLIFFYSFLEWEFERKWIRKHTMTEEELVKSLADKYGDAVIYGIGFSVNGKHILTDDVYINYEDRWNK